MVTIPIQKSHKSARVGSSHATHYLNARARQNRLRVNKADYSHKSFGFGPLVVAKPIGRMTRVEKCRPTEWRLLFRNISDEWPQPL